MTYVEKTLEAASEKMGISAQQRRVLKRLLHDLVRAKIDADRRRLDVARSAAGEDEGPHSYVRVPFFSNVEQARPLQRSVGFAASQVGVTHFTGTLFVTHLLEAIVDEVANGRIVRVPGFGIFGPYLWTSRDTGEQAAFPRFVAARGFRQHVRAICTADMSRNDELLRYQRHHHPSSRPDRAHGRTFRAMQAWRSAVEKQARAVGYDA